MNYDHYILTNRDKEPVDPHTGNLINAHDSANWMSRSDAERLAETTGRDIAYVITDDEPTAAIDIDKCRDPETGAYDERAMRVFNAMPGVGVEISRSGTGLHFWFCCEAGLDERFMNRADGIEFYQHGRYIILGSAFQGDPTIDATDWLPSILTPRPNSTDTMPVSGPVPEYTGPSDDMQLLAMIMQSRPSAAAAFGAKASFKDLWNANVEVLSKVFPAYGDDEFDRSSADAALLAHLAFWTGRDAARMERLWLASPLSASRKDRRKLDRQDYRTATVTGAARTVGEVYSKPPPSPPQHSLPTASDPVAAPAGEYLTTSDQVRHFDGCVYIIEEHVILTPNGRLLRPEQFRVVYGGHEFQMTADGSKPTKDAFEAFTQNRCHRFPQVERRRYWPDKPFGLIVGDEVNMFRKPVVERSDGDVGPFMDLLSRLLPVASDRAVLLAWMASAVQNPGKKFQWAVVLQGTEGNGKTFLLKCMEYAIGPSVTHLPNPEDMGEKYNTYIEGNLFIGVEEVHISGRREVMDRLKKYVTNSRVEVRGMRADKRMADNLTNWMFLTNYQDAVLKSRNDRRYAVFFTAQQSHSDILRDGMGGSYFPTLWSWWRDGGDAAVAGFLARYDIPVELDPAGECHRAPHTSSTEAAVSHSLGPIEQSIMDAVGEGQQGFRGGWISSIKLKEWLRNAGFNRVSNHLMRDALSNIGYSPCEAWLDGRASVVMEEGNRRPTLYCVTDVQKNNPTIQKYLDSQGYNPPGENIVKFQRDGT